MRSVATELLRGAVDLHTHCYPEVALDLPKRMEDWEWAAYARDVGMRAIVLKSQVWPTMGAAYHLQRLVPDILVLGSITLNSCVGGVERWVVEAAARMGARVVFMPTWQSAHDLQQQSFSKMMKGWFPSLEGLTPEQGISILDAEGNLLPNAAEVLSVAHARNLVLCTGHLSPPECIALGREADRIGFRRLVQTHPHNKSVGATLEQLHQMADLGAYIEIVCGTIMPYQRGDPQLLVKVIREIGPERCVLVTDYFRESNPPPPDMLRMLIGTLLELGVEAEALRTMAQVNPCKLLGLDESQD